MAEMEFAFIIGGKIINPAEVEDEEIREEISYVVEAIMDRADGLVCPEHGEGPRFLCTGDDFDSVNIEASGCCDTLIKEVRKRLSF